VNGKAQTSVLGNAFADVCLEMWGDVMVNGEYAATAVDMNSNEGGVFYHGTTTGGMNTVRWTNEQVYLEAYVPMVPGDVLSVGLTTNGWTSVYAEQSGMAQLSLDWTVTLDEVYVNA
jgi:hypothetical protein